jgi:hypothetical protein
MKALTNPSPEAMLHIDNEILMENFNQLFNKFTLLKTEAYSPSAVIRLADEMRSHLENVCRCLSSKQTIEHKIYVGQIETQETIAKGWQETAEYAATSLKKCVANS